MKLTAHVPAAYENSPIQQTGWIIYGCTRRLCCEISAVVEEWKY